MNWKAKFALRRRALGPRPPLGGPYLSAGEVTGMWGIIAADNTVSRPTATEPLKTRILRKLRKPAR